MTADAAVEYDTDVYVGTCWECQGPCAFYKGDVHGWRCRACIDRYLDEGAARWAAKSQKQRDKVLRNLRSLTQAHNNNTDGGTATSPGSAANDRRRDAAAGCGPRHVSTPISMTADDRISAQAS
ncbi:hypothetical protein LIX17_06810 [Mycobacterium avium subsp. hominissuis]|uniref:hypothetical protein n=1 Tax=Mycobacterium avium TaxID=1764 RepID=UPI000BB13761|nr:hypothetical protein [Mycobacterium avium]PBD11482.1 hypothetical protein BI295_19705 [Mycobacterium avium subsp. hominissuis]